MVVSGDATAGAIMLSSFDAAEASVRSFGRHQLGVKPPPPAAVSRWPRRRPRA
jgi:hypothetical protein